MNKDRQKIIEEIKELWPKHLQDEWVSLGEQTSTLDGNFSRNDLKRICVGMTQLSLRLSLGCDCPEPEIKAKPKQS